MQELVHGGLVIGIEKLLSLASLFLGLIPEDGLDKGIQLGLKLGIWKVGDMFYNRK